MRANAIYREIDRDLALVPMTKGTADAGFAGRSGKAAAVDSFGLAGYDYHARDEYIEIDSIVARSTLPTSCADEDNVNGASRPARDIPIQAPCRHALLVVTVT